MHNKEAFTFHAELDRRALQSYYDGNLSYACDMFGAFIQHGPDEADKLLRLLEAEDVPGMAAALHKVQPCLAMVGLSALARQAGALRTRLLAGQYDEDTASAIHALIANLRGHLPLIHRELVRMRQALSN